MNNAILIAFLVAFLHGANFSATSNPRAYKAVCYDYVGCFNNLPPFDNAHLNLPQSPNQIDTQFLLFTRRNPQNPDYLNYIFPTSIIYSHYQKTSATKIIIHGFSNSMITPWIHAMKDAFLKKVWKRELHIISSDHVYKKCIFKKKMAWCAQPNQWADVRANTLVAIATGLVFLNTLLRIALYNYMHLLSLLWYKFHFFSISLFKSKDCCCRETLMSWS